MSKVVPLLIEPDGVIKEWHTNNDGTYTVVTKQVNETEILDRNKAMYTHNDGYTPSREMQRVGSIPKGLIEYWMTVEGWNPFAPENEGKLAAKLDDIDFLSLRTAPGRLGKKHRHI